MERSVSARRDNSSSTINASPSEDAISSGLDPFLHGQTRSFDIFIIKIYCTNKSFVAKTTPIYSKLHRLEVSTFKCTVLNLNPYF